MRCYLLSHRILIPHRLEPLSHVSVIHNTLVQLIVAMIPGLEVAALIGSSIAGSLGLWS